MTADIALAARLARDAGALLAALAEDGALQGRALGDAGDAAANAMLMDALRRERPDDAILCEEERDDPARLTARRVWIIDPLDGTREYGERRDDWAVHVALAVDGQPVVGAVALPALHQCWTSAPAPQPARDPSRPPRMVVSRTRPAPETQGVAAALGAALIPMGSAGAKAMAVVRGEAEIYLHSGGQYEWDNCAPVAVALAHGLTVTRLDGTPLTYNRPDPYVADLIICHPAWAEPLRAALAG